MGPCSKQHMALGSGTQGRDAPILSPPSSALYMPLHPPSLPQQVLALFTPSTSLLPSCPNRQ